MRVIQAVFGTYHHFELATELEARNYLQTIYSTFLWRRLQREGVSRERVKTFPWIHAPEMVARRYWRIPKKLEMLIGHANTISFDAWVTQQLEECDAYVALSGAGMKSGKRAQKLGAKHVCDRGSSHFRYQMDILADEYQRWGAPKPMSDPRNLERHETEYANADAITVPSEFARRTFIELGVPAGKVHKIPYGVRLERFWKSSEPPRDSFEVLFAGTVSLRKGVPYLLEAFQQFKHPRKRLRLAGPVDPVMQTIFQRFDMSGVEVLGRQTQPQLAELMSSSHVMVLPSIEEGLALVQGQALACGCPLISSVHSGGEDLITHGVEGFLIPIRSPQAIVDRLQQLADDPALQQRMSESAMRRVQHLGGWRQYGESYSNLLRKLCGCD